MLSTQRRPRSVPYANVLPLVGEVQSFSAVEVVRSDLAHALAVKVLRTSRRRQVGETAIVLHDDNRPDGAGTRRTDLHGKLIARRTGIHIH